MLSVTYATHRRYTYAVVYGCQPKIREEIVKRLDAVEVFHPMVLPTIFADIERDRHIKHARKLHGQLITKSSNIPNMHNSSSLSGKDTAMRELVEYSTSDDMLSLWKAMRQLKSGLLDWQDQLNAMIEHVESLSSEQLCPTYTSVDDAASSESGRTPVNNRSVVADDLIFEDSDEDLMNLGVRIRRRLYELREEYSSTVRTCDATLEVTSLANQIVSSSVSDDENGSPAVSSFRPKSNKNPIKPKNKC